MRATATPQAASWQSSNPRSDACVLCSQSTTKQIAHIACRGTVDIADPQYHHFTQCKQRHTRLKGSAHTRSCDERRSSMRRCIKRRWRAGRKPRQRGSERQTRRQCRTVTGGHHQRGWRGRRAVYLGKHHPVTGSDNQVSSRKAGPTHSGRGGSNHFSSQRQGGRSCGGGEGDAAASPQAGGNDNSGGGGKRPLVTSAMLLVWSTLAISERHVTAWPAP